MSKAAKIPAPAVLPDDSAAVLKEARKSKAKRGSSFIGEALVAVIIALVITALLRIFVFQVFKVPSGSMEHTLEKGDRIAALRLVDFRRGDVVVFEDPEASWMGPQRGATNPVRKFLEKIYLLPDSSQGYLVKRVIGMPGDHVSCCDTHGRVQVNGYSIDESEYLYTEPDGTQVKPSDTEFSVVVPKDRIFVMGDHRNRSGDSRLHMCQQLPGKQRGEQAFVPIEDVVGPVGATIFPFDRIIGFSTPHAFDHVPPPSTPFPDHPIISEDSCPK